MRRWLWLALWFYILRWAPADPVSQGGTDFWDECAAGPADDEDLSRRAP
jgi:hypothetical protein